MYPDYYVLEEKVVWNSSWEVEEAQITVSVSTGGTPTRLKFSFSYGRLVMLSLSSNTSPMRPGWR